MARAFPTARAVVLAFALAPGAAGCGEPRAYVTGRVVYADGSPMAEGNVVFETEQDGKRYKAQGEIGPDGAFSLGEAAPGDGTRPGRHRALVVPFTLSFEEETRRGPRRDAKFQTFETSGLQFDVKPGKNEFTITVTRPPKNAPRQPLPQ